MKIQSHIDKISWSLGDKVLIILYGFIFILQLRALDPVEFGLYQLLIGFYTWIFVVSDGIALQSIIQFGMNLQNRPKTNLMSLIMQVSITLSASMLVFAFRYPLSDLFNEPRFVTIGEWLPLFVILTIPRTYTIKLVIRDREYKNLFFIDFAFYGIMTIATVVMVYSYKQLYFSDMVFIYLSGIICSSITGIIVSARKLQFSYKGSIGLREIMKFSLPYGSYAILHSIPKNLDMIIVQTFFSTAATGIYQSAKNLYRIFDEILNASYSLVYPSAVNLFEKGDKKGLNDLMTKSASFIFYLFTFAVIVLEAGFGEWFITTFLPVKYHFAVGQFNLMILAALAMSFTLTSVVITAHGKPKLVLLIVSVSAFVSVASNFIVGYLRESSLMPLGIILYNVVFGFLSFMYVNKKLDFKFHQIFRAFGDSLNFLKGKLNKRKNESGN